MALEILHIFWGIHKQGLVHNSISTDGLVMKLEQGQKYNQTYSYFFALTVQFREAHVFLADVGEIDASAHSPKHTDSKDQEQATMDYKYISPEFTGTTLFD